MKSVFKCGNGCYDVFLGSGWNNWTRIQWLNQQWTAIGGNESSLKQAVWTFTNSRKGGK